MQNQSEKYSICARMPSQKSRESSFFLTTGQNDPQNTIKSSLMEDESSVGSKESYIFDDSKVVKVMDKFGVRICPSVVKFENTFENQSYTETVSVQNISDISVTVRIHNPRAWSFRVTPLERGYLLAPGLKITRRLHYTCTKNGMVQSTLPIHINDNVIELPLEALKGQAFVEITPTSIRFGRVDIGCKPVERKILIKNVSFCATKFLVDVGSNELALHVSPIKGWIRPYSHVTVMLQLLALREGKHSSELWITTDLCQTRVHVEVEASRRSLMAIHPNTISDFTLVDFPVTFYGCRRYQTVVVYNMAASSSAFVVLADYGIKGQEPFSDAKNGSLQHVKMFDVEPLEGRINPFEERIFTFWFNPKTFTTTEGEESGWKNGFNKDINDYLCAVRIKRIQVEDIVEDPDLHKKQPSDSLRAKEIAFSGDTQSNFKLDVETDEDMEDSAESLSVLLMEDVSLLFYLYGEAEMPSLSATPDTLYFPNSLVKTTVVKVVQLTNNTNHILAFQYSKIPFFEVFPDFKKLAAKSSCDVTVKMCASNIGVLKKNLIFDILAERNATDKQNFHVVGQTTVRIFGEVKSQKIIPKPKFNPGITPMITHEVGFLADEVTFSSKVEKPRCAMTAASNHGRMWHQSNATIAFPNDRPLKLRPRPTDATAKTIYKGLDRYVIPVDETLTYTLDELVKRKVHDEWFVNFIRGTAAQSISKKDCCKWKFPKPDPDPSVVLFKEKEPSLPCDVFVPLTFVQLYCIKIYPALISFGSVTTSKSCSQLLNIDNANAFKISARIVPFTSGIYVQTQDSFIIEEKSEAKIPLTFQSENLGRYSGTITCIINSYHSFDVAVVAEVVHHSLTIVPSYVEIKIPDVPFADLSVPVSINNPLNIPISFSWIIPDESPIKIEPIMGVTPKRGTVWCGVFFEPENPNYKLHPIKLMVEGSAPLKLKTGVVLPRTSVYFLEPVLNVGYIPMNLNMVKRFFIFNPDFSNAMFVILNKDPVKGVKVKPAAGTVKPKSCHSLSLHIKLTSEKPLDFTIYMTLQNLTTIEMRVIGYVVYPEVEVLPKYINLHRVPCNSVTRTTLTAENKSQAKAEISFDMDEYPQFKVSLNKGHHDPGLTNYGFTLRPGETQKFYLHFIPKDLASYDFYLPILINKLSTSRNSSTKDLEAQGKLIKGIIRLISTEGKRYSSNTFPESAKVVPVMSHLVLVNVIVLKASLIISDLELSFSSTSETKSFFIQNSGDQPICVMIPEDLQGSFDIQVKGDGTDDKSSFKQTLLPGDSISYLVTFSATSPGLYVTDIPILASFEEHSCIYNTVRLTGNILFTCVITSSVKEIYFQPVPLNVEVSFIFHLDISHNQEKIETTISYEINRPHMNLFKVEFEEGNIVSGVKKCKIPVKITFCSNFAVSLRDQITFKSDKYSECSVTMIATAENCLLTIHAFLKTHFRYEQRLKVFEEFTEKVLEHEKSTLTKQQLVRQPSKQTRDSVSGGSKQSFISIKTIGSLGESSKLRRSYAQCRRLKTSGVGQLVEKERQHSNSDIELSFELSEKEEKLQPKKESLVIHEIITKVNDEQIFPMFPLEQSSSENAVHMNKTRNSIQQWVYEQVFCCSYNPIFGSHSFSSFSVGNKKDYGTSFSVPQKNVFDALERICGRRIRRYFTPIDKIPEDKMAKALFTYNLYQQLLHFMETQGALMAHVEPKYLMVYDEYCSYLKSQELSSAGRQSTDDDNSDEINAENFFSISVQCWLDLFLQMFKTLVLGPAVGVTYFTSYKNTKRTTLQTHDSESSKTFYSRAEEILLVWLTHQYNTQRTIVWPNKSPPPRTVSNFDMDLEDGLVLTATTASYCPYLNQIYFQDMCLHPITFSDAYHNATCLCMAWGSIRLGYSITARDFVHPNPIKMLLLVTHLYKILPSYKPEATITFSAILNASESQIVTLENNEEVSITYHVEILPHSTNFSLQDYQNPFVLKRKSKGQISVQYMARNTNTAEAILLLCGACMPPKFGRNYVFKLEGYPVKLPVSSSYNIVSPQNTPMDTHITVESPHALDFKAENSYSYDLWIAYSEPQPGNLNALRWAKERKRKIPGRIFFTSNTLIVTMNKRKIGSGVLSFKVCCFSQIVRCFWLVFRNSVIGDFIVRLQVTPRRPEPVMNLQVVINQKEPILTHNQSTTVLVPCRNLEQWAAVRTMFELTTTPAEKEFWATYIESNVGFRLLQWLLEEKKEKLNQELEALFKKSKTYNVACLSKYISCMHTIHIPDVRSKATVPIELHLDKGTPSHSTVLNLTSTDTHEIRSFNLKIVIADTNKNVL